MTEDEINAHGAALPLGVFWYLLSRVSYETSLRALAESRAR